MKIIRQFMKEEGTIYSHTRRFQKGSCRWTLLLKNMEILNNQIMT